MPASITGGTTTTTTITIITTSSSSTKLCKPTGTSRRCPPPRALLGTASAFSRTREGPRRWAAARQSCVPTLPAWAPAPRLGLRVRPGTTDARRCHPRRRRREVAAKGKAIAQVRTRQAPWAKGAGRRRGRFSHYSEAAGKMVRVLLCLAPRRQIPRGCLSPVIWGHVFLQGPNCSQQH